MRSSEAGSAPGGGTELARNTDRDSLGTLTGRAYTSSDIGNWIAPIRAEA